MMSHHCFRDSAHLQEFLSNTYNNLKCSLLLGLRFRAKLSQDGSSEKAGKKSTTHSLVLVTWESSLGCSCFRICLLWQNARKGRAIWTRWIERSLCRGKHVTIQKKSSFKERMLVEEFPHTQTATALDCTVLDGSSEDRFSRFL